SLPPGNAPQTPPGFSRGGKDGRKRGAPGEPCSCVRPRFGLWSASSVRRCESGGGLLMKPLGHLRRGVRIAATLTLGLAFFLASCGTLLYPERRGQPVGRLDVGVVALDGVGLLLFLVPGVIAFLVDFATGAIYLPPEYALLAPPPGAELRQ